MLKVNVDRAEFRTQKHISVWRAHNNSSDAILSRTCDKLTLIDMQVYEHLEIIECVDMTSAGLLMIR